MHGLLQDLRYALRRLRGAPGFTAAAVLTLALGIGANTAIFTVVDSVLLRPLPYRDPSRLVMVWERNAARGSERNVVSPANYLDWRAQTRAFRRMAAGIGWQTNLTGSGDPEVVPVGYTTAEYFGVLGLEPRLGRFYSAAEDVPRAPKVVVLSEGLWQRRFGGDPGIIGKTITLDGGQHTVVGVAPAAAALLGQTAPAVWVPLGFDPAVDYRAGSGRYLWVVARLHDGVTAAAAQSQLATVAAQLADAHPNFNRGWSVTVVPLAEAVVGGARRTLLLLAGVVLVVLLIACANVANLQLAQAAARQREFAVRAALGGDAKRLARQLLIESLVLAVAGAALGVLLALWGVETLTAVAPAAIPRSGEISLDGRALGVTLALAVGVGLLFGLAPALQAGRADLHDTLKQGGRGATGSARRLRAALVAGQVALSLVLLVGAALLLKSFERLQQVHPGFDPDGVLTARISLPSGRYDTPEKQSAFFEQLSSAMRGVPGVRAVGATTWLPLSGLRSATRFTIDGRAVSSSELSPAADIRSVDAGYFQAMRIPLLQGRQLEAGDRRNAPTVVVVSEALVRKFFPAGNPLGQRIRMPWEPDTLLGTIVGVVGDVRHLGLDSLAPPTIYWALPQFPMNFATLVVRTAGDPMALAGPLAAEVRTLDPSQPVADVKTLDEYLGNSVARRRFSMTLLGAFAGLALALTAIGLYGVTSYTVAQHTREFGIRLALGASARSVLRAVVGRALAVAGAGIAVGLVAALALTRLLTALLFGVSSTDPAVYAGIALLLAAVSAAASYTPARRATRVDPVVALRTE